MLSRITCLEVNGRGWATLNTDGAIEGHVHSTLVMLLRSEPVAGRHELAASWRHDWLARRAVAVALGAAVRGQAG
jgi:hypothetical protein